MTHNNPAPAQEERIRNIFVHIGHSIASSLATCDKEIAEWYTTGNGRYNPKQPISA